MPRPSPQGFYPVHPEATFLPGDQLTMACDFDSSTVVSLKRPAEREAKAAQLGQGLMPEPCWRQALGLQLSACCCPGAVGWKGSSLHVPTLIYFVAALHGNMPPAQSPQAAPKLTTAHPCSPSPAGAGPHGCVGALGRGRDVQPVPHALLTAAVLWLVPGQPDCGGGAGAVAGRRSCLR